MCTQRVLNQLRELLQPLHSVKNSLSLMVQLKEEGGDYQSPRSMNMAIRLILPGKGKGKNLPPHQTQSDFIAHWPEVSSPAARERQTKTDAE